ncbi:MAG: glycosyltransferase [Mycobacterium sp.]|nr:glycosyltransferase [Mycobacterium sp.]
MEAKTGHNLVSICLLLPYTGVDHAGGELLLRHYKVLAEQCSRVDTFAIDYDDNLLAASRDSDIAFDSYQTTIINFPRWRKTIAGKIIARIWTFLLPVLPDIGIYAAFASSKSLRERLLKADIVELQWYEFFFFARLVKRLNAKAEVIGFAHDIPTQKIERRLTGWPAPARRLYLNYASWLQHQMLRGIDKVTVLSAKDAELLTKRPITAKTAVLNPPLDLGEPTDTDRVRQVTRNHELHCNFGFIAAFYRPENDDAGLWLLTDIWPRVIERCPRARLYLVGSKPSAALQRAADKLGESVTVTGYVDDIDSFYDRIGTVVIPLRYGAGVKFKTISGILARKNIVATPVAIEGTLPEEFFFRVSDSAAALADAMIELAADPQRGRTIADAARDEVGSRYSSERYARTVKDVYGL